MAEEEKEGRGSIWQPAWETGERAGELRGGGRRLIISSCLDHAHPPPLVRPIPATHLRGLLLLPSCYDNVLRRARDCPRTPATDSIPVGVVQPTNR